MRLNKHIAAIVVAATACGCGGDDARELDEADQPRAAISTTAVPPTLATTPGSGLRA